MRFHTYSKFSPELADAVDLQSLLEKLADFLLQSGFAGGRMSHPYWGDFGGDADRSLDALKEAILNALIESGQFTPEMLRRCAATATRKRRRSSPSSSTTSCSGSPPKAISTSTRRPRCRTHTSRSTGRGGLAHAASRDVQFNLTEKGIDFLGYKTLRHILGSLGKSSFGSHDTPYLATGIEADGWSKPYEFGDVLNLDVNETLKNSLARTGSIGVPIDLDYSRPDGAPGRVPLVVRDGADARHVALDDPLRRGPLHAGEEGRARAHAPHPHAVPRRHASASCSSTIRPRRFRCRRSPHAQVGPYHTNTAEGLKLARRILLAQKKDMRQIIMITDGKPSALTMPNGQIYKNSMGLDATVIAQTLQGGRELPPLGDHDQHVHARPRPRAGGVREARLGDQPRQGVLHEHDDARPVHPHGLPAEEDAQGQLTERRAAASWC